MQAAAESQAKQSSYVASGSLVISLSRRGLTYKATDHWQGAGVTGTQWSFHCHCKMPRQGSWILGRELQYLKYVEHVQLDPAPPLSIRISVLGT